MMLRAMDTKLDDDSRNADMAEELLHDLDQLNEELDSVDIEEGLQELATVQSHGRQTFAFLDEDEEFQRVLGEGGLNPCARMDKWAVNRLNAYRSFRGLNVSVPITELPDRDLSKLLTKFFEQACKKDGSLYPTQSLMALYRGFHRVLVKAQELRIQRTGIDEPRFSLKNSPIYMCVGKACVLAMHRSRAQGANLPRKKASIISMADEKTILSHSCTSKSNARGLQKRCAYYMLSRFCIRGGSELYTLRAADFMLGGDERGDFVKYDERLSKNYKVSLGRYQDEHFRPPITEYDADVYDTMSLMIAHAPASVKYENRFLFHQPIDNPRSISWYSSSRVSLRNLYKWLKLIHEECGLISDGITNKSGRTTCVTRMAAEGVPPAVGMMITGHKSAGAYARYDRSGEARVRAAQKCIADGTDFGENVKDETLKLKGILVEGPRTRDRENESAKKRKDITMGANEQGSHNNALMALDENRATLTVNANSKAVEDKKDMVSIQTTQDYDNWASLINWEKVDGDLATKGIYIGRNVINPITAVFGKTAVFGNNCNITINLGNGSNLAGAIGGITEVGGSSEHAASNVTG